METRHAELSWAIAQWIETRLDRDGRRRVREAQEQAVVALMCDAGHEPDASLSEQLGVPSASQARAVVEAGRMTFGTIGGATRRTSRPSRHRADSNCAALCTSDVLFQD